MFKIRQTQLVETMKNMLKLLILILIIDQTMPQCGIRWRGTCNRNILKKANRIRYPVYQENTIEKRAFRDDDHLVLKTPNAKRQI